MKPTKTEKIITEEWAKEIGCSVSELNKSILKLIEEGYISCYEYDKDGNPIEFSINANNKKEARKLLLKVGVKV